MADLNPPAQASLQPFARLAQANWDAYTQFTQSPEVSNWALNLTQRLVEQTQASWLQLAQTGAFNQLAGNLMQNYSRFALELAQSGMGLATQGASQFMNQAQQAGQAVVTMTDEAQREARRPRQAA